MEKVTDIFERIKIDICDNKCKYPSEYDMKDEKNGIRFGKITAKSVHLIC